MEKSRALCVARTLSKDSEFQHVPTVGKRLLSIDICLDGFDYFCETIVGE